MAGLRFYGSVLAVLATLGVSGLAHGALIYSGTIQVTGSSPATYNLTRAGQVTPDYTLNAFGPSGYEWAIRITSSTGNKSISTTDSDGRWASALADGSMIDSSGHWELTSEAGGNTFLSRHTFWGYAGSWVDGQPHYLGLALQLQDGVHYGWLRASTNIDPAYISYTVVDWAYESEPNVSVAASSVPEPAALATLALGAGVLLLRHRRK